MVGLGGGRWFCTMGERQLDVPSRVGLMGVRGGSSGVISTLLSPSCCRRDRVAVLIALHLPELEDLPELLREGPELEKLTRDCGPGVSAGESFSLVDWSVPDLPDDCLEFMADFSEPRRDAL